jgi:hypothetical protein
MDKNNQPPHKAQKAQKTQNTLRLQVPSDLYDAFARWAATQPTSMASAVRQVMAKACKWRGPVSPDPDPDPASAPNLTPAPDPNPNPAPSAASPDYWWFREEAASPAKTDDVPLADDW